MNKGFIAIMVAMAFFIVAALMMGLQQATPHSASFKENFSSSAMFVSNYENLLNQATAQDCNRNFSDENIIRCIEQDSNTILGKGSSIRIIPPYTTCFTTALLKSPDINTVKFDLNCTTDMNSSKGTLFYSNFAKKITVKK